jgi:hypothetical protein
LGDGEQGRRRRQEEWIGSGQEGQQELVAQRRAQGRCFAIQSIALGGCAEGRCYPPPESQSRSWKRQRGKKQEEHRRQSQTSRRSTKQIGLQPEEDGLEPEHKEQRRKPQQKELWKEPQQKEHALR